MEASPTNSPVNMSSEAQTTSGSPEAQGSISPSSQATFTPPQAGKLYSIPGLPAEYCCSLQPSLDPMAKVAGLKVLGDRRSTASLGLFVVIFFGLTLTLLAVGEALQLTLPAASPLLDMVMTLTLLLLLVAPVALAAMLGISLGQAIRQPKQRINPDLEKVWLLQRGQTTVGKLRIMPEGLRQRLLWVRLEPKYRGQGIGQAFVSAVLSAEGQPCRVKVDNDGNETGKNFFQGCGFQLPPGQAEPESSSKRRSPWGKSNPIWLVYTPK